MLVWASRYAGEESAALVARLSSLNIEDIGGGGGGAVEGSGGGKEPATDPRLLTPGLRRRRLVHDKYVTDQAQLHLRFNRPRRIVEQPPTQTNPNRVRGIPTHLLMFPAGEENSEKDSDSSGNAANLAPRPPLPPEGLPSENNARCRRFHPVTMADGNRES